MVDSPLNFIKEYYKVLKALPPKSAFHYPLNSLFFLHFFRKDKVTVSYCDCTMTPSLFSLKSYKVRAYLAGLFADKIDVLSSDIFNNLKKSFMLKQKCSQTPNGSFVFANDYKALSKKPYVVFLSRLTEGKGLTDFLNILPKLWEEIKIKAPKNIEFIIAGKGNLFDFAQKQTLLLKENGIPISMAGEVHTPSFLQNVSVFLSLQEVTNYPSRVIAESLFSGTQVIIRNTGDSKKIGNLTGIDYCSATLNDKELSEKILISIKKALNEEHIKQTILEAKNIFSSKKTIDYFESLIS